LKIRITGVLVILLFGGSVWACDVCSIYLSINPNDYKNSIGLHYRMRAMQGTIGAPVKSLPTKHLGHLNSYEGEQTVNEVYQLMELRGQYFFTERFHLVLTIPVSNNYRSVGDFTNTDVYGFGDPVLLAKYQLFNTRKREEMPRVTHRIIGGAGVKAPFGSTTKSFNGSNADIDMQPGTGSIDFFALAEYVMFIKQRWGISANAIYKMNTANRNQFQYGNVLASNLNFFASLKMKRLMFQPALGGYMEMAAFDMDQKEKLSGTGGTVVYSTAGLYTYLGRFNWMAQFQYATINKQGSDMLPNKFRLIAGVNYNF
jgi:hypothetical protein